MFYKFLISLFIFSYVTVSFAANSGEASFNAAVISFKQKKYKSALTLFKKAYSQGMREKTLYFNIAATYYKLGNYNKARANFNHIKKDKKFRQIAYYNLGLIAEKQKRTASAIKLYKKTLAFNQDEKLNRLANLRLDILLKKKKIVKNKTQGSVNLAVGNDDNITSAASNSPSNKSDSSIELFAYIKSSISNNTNFKANYYLLKYSKISTEDFSFYSLGVDHTFKVKNWKIIPEISFMQSDLNSVAYQNIFNFKVSGKYRISKDNRLALRYRTSNISSQNSLYNYLNGQRQQFRIDYKTKVNIGRLRLRYQFETNRRQNTATSNYSPTRHTLRVQLRHKLSNSWSLSEEIGYRASKYDPSATVTRDDTRLRLRIKAARKINKNWSAGLRYIYTDNDSNIASEKYTRNKIQAYTNWNF